MTKRTSPTSRKPLPSMHNTSIRLSFSQEVDFRNEGEIYYLKQFSFKAHNVYNCSDNVQYKTLLMPKSHLHIPGVPKKAERKIFFALIFEKIYLIFYFIR